MLYAVALAAGYLSHLVLDFVTYEGVPWFWPFDDKYSLDLGLLGVFSSASYGSWLWSCRSISWLISSR
jgi:membrane-bound metal-dependent hydrolase YbcI (DUF457 family)